MAPRHRRRALADRARTAPDHRQSQDPFRESPDTEVMIGVCQVVLQPLAFRVELKDQLDISNFKGTEVGVLNVSS